MAGRRAKLIAHRGWTERRGEEAGIDSLWVLTLAAPLGLKLAPNDASLPAAYFGGRVKFSPVKDNSAIASELTKSMRTASPDPLCVVTLAVPLGLKIPSFNSRLRAG